MAEYPWLHSYPAGIDWHKNYHAQSLPTMLEKAVARFHNRPCIDFFGFRMTYGALDHEVHKLAKGLQAIGVRKGVKVGLFLPNCPQFVVSYFAILKAGGTVVNYSPLYAEPELLQQVEDSETDIMVTLSLEALFPTIHKVYQESRLKHLVVGRLDDALPFPKGLLYRIFKRRTMAVVDWKDAHIHDYRTLLKNDGVCRPVTINPEEDVAVLQYTGGTTGVPKGAMLTHANIYINTLQSRDWFPEMNDGQEVAAAFLPFFHVFAMTAIMTLSIVTGAEMAMLPKFDIKEALKLIRRRRPTLMAGVPTMYTALLGDARAKKAGLDRLKICLSGGAPLSQELKKKFEETFGGQLLEGYGLTEASPVVSANPMGGAGRAGTIGLPLPATKILITNPDNPEQVLAQGEKGEICVEGPQVMASYWQRPEATEDVLQSGRLRTGDIGYMDEEGYTFIIDRSKDLILVGGFNVFPRMIEEAIYQHPAVHEVTVIGIPDDYLGEVPKAFVSLKHPDENLTPEELQMFLKDKLGKHERPAQIEFRDDLPKTMIGKLSKKELVAEEKAKSTAQARSK